MTDTNLESILFDNGNFIWYILLNFIYDKVYDSFLKLYSYYQIKFYLIQFNFNFVKYIILIFIYIYTLNLK